MNFQKVLKKYQAIVNKELKKFFDSVEIPEAQNFLVKEEIKVLKNFCLSPGKRIRPIMAIMAFRGLSKKDEKKFILPFLSLEIFHNYTLIHDDIYDEDVIRRGEPTPHFLFSKLFEKRYKNAAESGLFFKNNKTRFGAITGFINGEIVKSLSNFIVINDKNIDGIKKLEILRLFQGLDMIINIGQAMDLFFEKEEKITEKDYIKMAGYKTGELFKAPVELGAILAGATENQINCLKNYANNLAIAFQIKDDLLDISIGGEKGRGIGSDIKQGKKTLLLIYALSKASQNQKKLIKKIIRNEKLSDKEIKEIIKLYNDLGAVNYCQKIAKQKIKKSLSWLDKINPRLTKEAYVFFKELASFIVLRKK